MKEAILRRIEEQNSSISNRLEKAIEEYKAENKIMQACREEGDLSENAGYHTSRDKLSFLNAEIHNLQEQADEFEVFKKEAQIDSPVVMLGSYVVLVATHRENESQEFSFVVVPKSLSNMDIGALSVNSPVGKAILGRKEGNIVEVITNLRKCSYKLKEVR